MIPPGQNPLMNPEITCKGRGLSSFWGLFVLYSNSILVGKVLGHSGVVY